MFKLKLTHENTDMTVLELRSILFIGVIGPYSLGRIVVQPIALRLHSFSRVAVYLDTSRPTDEGRRAILARYQEHDIEIIASEGYKSSQPFAGFDCVM